MGKLEYARKLCGEGASVCDLAESMPESAPDFNMNSELGLKLKNMFDARIVVNLQDGVRTMLEAGIDARGFFVENLPRLEDKILIGDEIGSGIVPVDPFERRWRDETGFIYQILARRARTVDRIWAGLPVRIKNSE